MALTALPAAIAVWKVKSWGQPTAPIPPMPEALAKMVWTVPVNDLIVTAYLEGFSRNIWRGFLRNTTQNARITALSQQLISERLVTLFELDLSRYKLGIARFTSEVTETGQAVRWNGYTFYPAQVLAEGFTIKGTGPNDRPTLKLANTTSLISSLVYEGRDLIGCLLRRIRTFRRFLDDGEEPNPEAIWPPEEYLIDRKKGQDKFMVEFELTTVLDQEGTMLPKRQILRDFCSFIYRLPSLDDPENLWYIDKYTPCPYAGSRYFNIKGEEVDQPTEDVCGKSLRDCTLRFGQDGVKPYGGFPGVARVR